MTKAAIQMAGIKLCAHQSQRVWTRRQPLIFSITKPSSGLEPGVCNSMHNNFACRNDETDWATYQAPSLFDCEARCRGVGFKVGRIYYNFLAIRGIARS